MDDKKKYPKLLQFAQVDIKKSDDCFKDVFDEDILKFPPKGWDKMKTQGFCYRGKKSEVNDCEIKMFGFSLKVVYKNLSIQISCKGDSGGAVVWDDTKCNRAYLVGIISQIHGKCEPPIQQSVAVTIPGEIFEWLMEKDGGKDIKDCLID